MWRLLWPYRHINVHVTNVITNRYETYTNLSREWPPHETFSLTQFGRPNSAVVHHWQSHCLTFIPLCVPQIRNDIAVLSSGRNQCYHLDFSQKPWRLSDNHAARYLFIHTLPCLQHGESPGVFIIVDIDSLWSNESKRS